MSGIRIDGLGPDHTVEKIRELFEAYGYEVDAVRIARYESGGQNSATAYIDLSDPSLAGDVAWEFDGMNFIGATIKVTEKYDERQQGDGLWEQEWDVPDSDTDYSEPS